MCIYCNSNSELISFLAYVRQNTDYSIAINYKCLKPIFHCNAKSFASGTFASPNAKDSTFALPNARNTNMLVSLVFYPTPTPDASQWNIGGVGPSDIGAGVGHVHFIFFV